MLNAGSTAMTIRNAFHAGVLLCDEMYDKIPNR